MRLRSGIGLAAAMWIAWGAVVAQDRKADRKKSAEALSQEESENYYQKWLRQDVFYIISEKEREVFDQLSNDDERDAFIEQFWRRRDTDPRTAHNEFKEEHYRRIAYANETFHSGEPGWKTDRGEFYIKFGPPDGRESHPNGGTYNRRLNEGGGTTTVHPFERWRYNHIEGVGPNVEIEFVDPSRTGEFRVALSPQDKDALLYVATTGAGQTEAEQLGLEDRWMRITRDSGLGIQARSAHYVIHPDDFPFEKLQRLAQMQQAPVAAEYKRLLTEVESTISYKPLDVEIAVGQVRIDSDRYLVPLTFEVPNRELDYAPQGDVYRTDVQVYGTVTDMGGRIWAEFTQDLHNYADSGQLAQERLGISVFQKLLELRSGRYKVEVISKDLGSGRLGFARKSLHLVRGAEDVFSLSPLTLADLVEPSEFESDEFEQFALGSMKVVPNVRKSFTPGDPLHVYLQAYNARLDQSSLSPSLQARYFLLKDGKLALTYPDLEGRSIKYVSAERVVLSAGFRLNKFEPGRYRLLVRVNDTISGQEASAHSDFSIVRE